MSKPDWISDVSDEDFQRAVIDRSHEVPVVADFWAPWCGPCRSLAPLLEKLVSDRKGEIVLAKVNVDEAQQWAGRFGVSSIPAVIGFRGGKPVLDFVGLMPEEQLREFLDRLMPSPAEQLTRQAVSLEKTKPVEAEAIYRQALADDPKQEPAILGLVRLLIAQGKQAEAKALLDNASFEEGERTQEAERLTALLDLHSLAGALGSEAEVRGRLDADPASAELHYELGCLAAVAGHYPEALQSLLEAAQRDSRLAADKVRPAMVKIFQIIGVRSPLADEYRNKLTTLLY